MKILTHLHKPAHLLLFLLCATLHAQQTPKAKSDRWTTREAFKSVDHFYVGAHIGIGLPFIFQDRFSSATGESTTILAYAFNLNVTPPQHRLMVGYKWKRHYFELAAETKVFQSNFYTYDPYQGTIFTPPSLGYYISAGYNIDLLPHLNSFKLNVGGSMGAYILSAKTKVSPAMGVNLMTEFPVNRIFSMFFDIRYAIGFLSQYSGSEYGGTTYQSRLMSMDFNFGCRFNIFSRNQGKLGWDKYNELKGIKYYYN